MATVTEGRRAGEFILSEAPGSRSRANGTVASGSNLVAGTVVAGTPGALVAWVSGAALGVLIDNVNATSAATPAAYIDTDAEVNYNLITPKSAGATTALAALGIKTRA